MADSTQSSIEIPAPPEQVMAVISDLESYPQWVDALSAVEVRRTAEKTITDAALQGLKRQVGSVRSDR